MKNTLAIALFSLSACSLAGTETEECNSNQECVQAFGYGSTCASDGFCAAPVPNLRCTKTFPEDIFLEPETYKDAYIMGSLMDQSISTHRARENSIRLAIEQFNGSQKISNRSLGAVFCTIQEDNRFDDLSRQDAALSTAKYLIEDLTIPAIIGPSSSSDYAYVSTELDNQDTLFVSPAATSVDLANLDTGPFTDEAPGMHWQVAPPDSLQATAIAEDMRKPGNARMNIQVENVSVIHKEDSYGLPLTSAFSDAFIANGGTTPGFLPFTDDTQLLAAVNTAAATNSLDEILFVSSQVNEIRLFINAISATGYTGNIFLTDAAANIDVINEITTNAPGIASQIRGTRPAPKDSNTDTNFGLFVSRYLSQFGQDVEQFSFTAHSFDAAFIVASAFAWAHFQEDEVNGKTMAKGMRKLSAGTSGEPIQWSSIVNALEQGNSVDLVGVSGELDFDATTEMTTAPIEIWRIQQDEISNIYTWQPPSF